MARKKKSNPTFDQTIATLKQHGFTATPCVGAPEMMQVSKYGAAAVLMPAADAAAAFYERPGGLIGNELARLLDRGYQKFLKTSKYEVPATATHLHGIHLFSEELNQMVGAVSYFNEGLGTTSELYQYDRLKGHKDDSKPGARPWETAAGR